MSRLGARSALSINAAEAEHIRTCPICLETYNETNRLPKILPCAHTFCLECVLAFDPSLCPNDRQPFNGGRANITALPNNFTIMGLLNERPQRRVVPSAPPPIPTVAELEARRK